MTYADIIWKLVEQLLNEQQKEVSTNDASSLEHTND